MASRVHLLVVLHGLWGTRAHIDFICKSAARYAQLKPESKSIKLVVFAPQGNEWVNTYDGIDTCAERVTEEIDEKIAELKSDGSTVERFSIVGYSLGGLVARYTLGLLASREPSFFDTVKPVNFVTFASPAIGIPTYRSLFARFIRFFGARVLSRSGRQLYGEDRFLPASFVNGTAQEKKRWSLRKEPAEPLLAVLADPRYSFYKALAAFEHIDIYTNAVNDRTVPYPTGAIETHDPFAAARAKAKRSATRRGEDPEIEPDISEGGLKVDLVNGAPIIATWTPVDPVVPKENVGKKPRSFPPRLPAIMRPSSWPFRRSVSVALIITMPISMPLFLCYLVTRFLLQSRDSRKRIKASREKIGGGRQGMLSRVGVRLDDAIAQITERMQPDNPEREIAHSTASSTTALNGSNGAPAQNGNGTPDGKGKQSSSRKVKVSTEPTDPMFTEAQLKAIENLNALPQLKKHLVYIPQLRHTHGAIIARDLSFEAHAKYGRPIVEHWAKDLKI